MKTTKTIEERAALGTAFSEMLNKSLKIREYVSDGDAHQVGGRYPSAEARLSNAAHLCRSLLKQISETRKQLQ